MKKRFLLVALTCVAVLGLAACGKNNSSSETGKLTIDDSDIEAESETVTEDLSDTPVTGNYFGIYDEDGVNNIAFYISQDDQCVLTFSTAKYGNLTGDCDIYENYIDFGGKKCTYVMDTNGHLTFTYKDISYGLEMIDEKTYDIILDGRETTVLDAEPVESEQSETESTEVETEESTETEDAASTEESETSAE